MNAKPQLRLIRVDTAGEPAAMVATWMMGELLNVPGVSVRFQHPDRVTLETGTAEELDVVQTRINTLLTEPRFARWAVRGG